MTATGKASQVMDALFAHAALLATTAPSLPVSFPEAPNFTPPTDGKYLRVSFFGNVPRWDALSVGVMDQGLLQISVVWPKNQGLIGVANAAAQVAAHFAKNTTLVSGATHVKVNNDPWVASPLTEENNVALPVTVPWTA